ncbi:zincin-like metalloproteases family protein [Actinidia rufa]|uniref:Zincin-like metalloproteases family protein n=1 Tax=Actinidia rufa TaxID=165716 RepID=A0A7J0HDJ4_9ERIC|nr:zincin-like metalloproteases family protein [Actinidia rufa]
MSKQKRERSTHLVVLTGAAALIAFAVNFAINAHKKNRKKKGLAIDSDFVVSDIPGSAVHLNLSSSEILRLADRIISKSKEVHDAVASVRLDKVTYANAILPLAELEAQQFPLVQSCFFPKLVSTSEDVRKASAEAERRIDAHVSSCSKREDVYRVIKAFAAKEEWMSSEAKRYTQCLVRDFERNGLTLTVTKREELQRLRAQIDELCRRYISNLNDDTASLLFSETELMGLPPEFFKSLDKAESGKFKVTIRSHHVSPVLELCKVGLTRRIVAVAYGRRCEINLSILESLVLLRNKFARLLGYSNYADYAVNHRMAKSSPEVFEFLEELSASLTGLATRELNMLKDLKKKRGRGSSIWNRGSVVLCEEGLRFDEIADAEVWHSDVRLYSVYDLSSSELLGYFYLDMFSREGKYGHTCVCVSLQNGSFVNGARKLPVALLISQVQKEVGGHTGLLRFSEVVNLFHEFGHVVCLIQIIHSTENVDMVGLFKHLHPKVQIQLHVSPRVLLAVKLLATVAFGVRFFAADIFASKFRDDLSNQFVGMEFRNKVLAPGGAKDPVEILFNFLGRKPSIQAFVDSKIEFGLGTQ